MCLEIEIGTATTRTNENSLEEKNIYARARAYVHKQTKQSTDGRRTAWIPSIGEFKIKQTDASECLLTSRGDCFETGFFMGH